MIDTHFSASRCRDALDRDRKCPSRKPICLFIRPLATRGIISRSREVDQGIFFGFGFNNSSTSRSRASFR